MIVLSHFQANPLLQAMKKGQDRVKTSLDLGLSSASLCLEQEQLRFPDGQSLTRDQLAEIADNELVCYRIVGSQIEKIQFFSETFNRFYSLMPTHGAPTMLISGIPMHRIKGTDPHQDTLSKIKAVTPVTGTVLDTTMGLGYTAIAAAQTAVSVTTIELDPTVVEIRRLNPWSQTLFTQPNLHRRIGDAYDEVTTFPDSHFSRIIHDPPTFSLAGHLYSTDFYRQLYRILSARGRLFHYIGDPDSKSGRGTTRGVVRRLQEAGFRRVKPYRQAFGVIATR